MPQARKPAIAILSDHVLFRQAVAQQLADQGFGPVVQVSTKDKLAAAARRRKVDVAIIDIDHDGEETYTLVKSLRGELPELHIVMLATPLGPPTDEAVVLEPNAEDRASALIALMPEQRTNGEEKTADGKTPHRNWSRITERQREVMRWLAVGLDNAAIGQKLRIGERAVKAHVSSLLGLFGLANRTQLALLADRAGLRPPARR
jgi:DNA-binding NarL/FixJ family response regulator